MSDERPVPGDQTAPRPHTPPAVDLRDGDVGFASDPVAPAHRNGSDRLDPEVLSRMVGHAEGRKRETKQYQAGVRAYLESLPANFLDPAEPPAS